MHISNYTIHASLIQWFFFYNTNEWIVKQKYVVKENTLYLSETLKQWLWHCSAMTRWFSIVRHSRVTVGANHKLQSCAPPLWKLRRKIKAARSSMSKPRSISKSRKKEKVVWNGYVQQQHSPTRSTVTEKWPCFTHRQTSPAGMGGGRDRTK